MREQNTFDIEKECKRVDFENFVKEIVKKHRLSRFPKHVDCMYICGNVIFLIEETETAKTEDIDKITESIDFIYRYVSHSSDEKPSIVGIIHFHREIDTVVAKKALSSFYIFANCDDELCRKIKDNLKARIK